MREYIIGLLMEAAADVNERHAISFCSNCEAQVHNFAEKISKDFIIVNIHVMKYKALFQKDGTG